MTRSPSTVRVASRPAAPLEAAWPPDPFAYLDGRLCVDGLPLDELEQLWSRAKSLERPA